MSRITRPARAATPDAAGQHGKAESARAAAAAHEAAPDEPTDDERDEFLHVRSRATKRNTKRPEGAVPSVFEMAARQRERHRQPAPIDADAVVFERGVPLVGQRHVITFEYDTLLARFEPGAKAPTAGATGCLRSPRPAPGARLPRHAVREWRCRQSPRKAARPG